MAWMLKKNGLTPKDVTVVSIDPGPAAQAFLAGQYDAVMTYEPYLSSIRAKPEAGKIIATTLDYPVVMDTFGCTPKYLAENGRAARAMTQSYFEALEMIAREPQKAYEIMGADVKQTRRGVREVGQRTCAGRTAPRTRNSSPASCRRSSRKPAQILLEIGVIKSMPDVNSTIDTSYIKWRLETA